MLALIIETSTEKSIVSIIENETLLFNAQLPAGLQNSKHLLPEIRNSLQAVGKKMEDFAFIISGAGPGSYTGMRVGAMTAKTFSYASKVPLVGVCSLMGFVPEKEGPFAAIIDAKISGAYLLQGNKSGSEILYTAEPRLLDLASAARLLVKTETILTPQEFPIREKLQKAADQELAFDWVECYPSPHQLYKIGKQKFLNKEYTTDGSLELMYMRKTQAEIEREI